MGISLATALEINNHPDDLYIAIGKPHGSNQYAIEICRGAGHNYKLLINSRPFADTAEQAVEQVKELLTGIHTEAENQMNNTESKLTKILSHLTDRSKALNEDLIASIVNQLLEYQEVDTSQMFISAS